MRRKRMNHLFACLSEAGIGNDQHHRWATGVLARSVGSFTTLEAYEIDMLITAAQEIIAAPPLPDYHSDEYDGSVLCGEIGPDGQECVVDAAHFWRGEDHAGADGRCWVLR